MRTAFYHFIFRKLPNFPVQDRLEVCLALLGNLHRSQFGFSSEWLKEHSQLTGGMIYIQVRPDILSGLIWVQTVCKSYRQTTLEGKELKNDKLCLFLSPDPKRIGGYSDQPGVRPSVRLSVRLSVRRQKLVRSITFIPFEIF